MAIGGQWSFFWLTHVANVEDPCKRPWAARAGPAGHHVVEAQRNGKSVHFLKHIWTTHWVVVYLPLWKIWKSVGIIIPNIWNIKNVPNHQSVNNSASCENLRACFCRNMFYMCVWCSQGKKALVECHLDNYCIMFYASCLLERNIFHETQ